MQILGLKVEKMSFLFVVRTNEAMLSKFGIARVITL